MARALLLVEAEPCEYCRLTIHTQTLPGGLCSPSILFLLPPGMRSAQDFGTSSSAPAANSPESVRPCRYRYKGLKSMLTDVPGNALQVRWMSLSTQDGKSEHNPVPALFKVRNCTKLRQISPVQFSSLLLAAHPNLKCSHHLHQNTLAHDRSI